MRIIIPELSKAIRSSRLLCGMHTGALLATVLLSTGQMGAQKPAVVQGQVAQSTTGVPVHPPARSSPRHKAAKPAPEPVAPPPPPMPKWPVNDSPSRASITWDSHGLRVEASNSSLQQILSEVALQTGSKVEGTVGDQRVYGSYGPGQAREVISQLLQGSGYNVLLAGDLGSGAPRNIVLTPRHNGAGGSAAPGATNDATQDNGDDDIPPDNEVDEQPPPPPPPQQPVPAQQGPNGDRPGFGPNGPIRTPQQVMEEMQRQQQLQQQQQQQQQGNQPNNEQ